MTPAMVAMLRHIPTEPVSFSAIASASGLDHCEARRALQGLYRNRFARRATDRLNVGYARTPAGTYTLERIQRREAMQ